MAMQFQDAVLNEIRESLTEVDEKAKERFFDLLNAADRVFVFGAGRSGLIMRAFAMRLMHCGYTVHFVGDVTAPPIRKGDLFLIGSASGEKGMGLVLAKRIKDMGIPMVLFSTNTLNSISQLADLTIKILAPTKRPDNTVQTVQLPGCRFEQSLMLFCDLLILEILEQDNDITMQTLKDNHTNLE